MALFPYSRSIWLFEVSLLMSSVDLIVTVVWILFTYEVTGGGEAMCRPPSYYLFHPCALAFLFGVLIGSFSASDMEEHTVTLSFCLGLSAVCKTVIAMLAEAVCKGHSLGLIAIFGFHVVLLIGGFIFFLFLEHWLVVTTIPDNCQSDTLWISVFIGTVVIRAVSCFSCLTLYTQFSVPTLLVGISIGAILAMSCLFPFLQNEILQRIQRIQKQWKMHVTLFMAVDVLSMLTFTIYVMYIKQWRQSFVGCTMAVIGWLLSVSFVVEFCLPPSDASSLTDKLQNASKISIAMDTGGKFFTYVIIGLFDKAEEDQIPPVVVLLEFATTMIEAMIKYQHAMRVRAREVDSNDLPYISIQ